jgi:hypothetical protein
VGDAEQLHPNPPADRCGAMVAGVCHGPHLQQAVSEAASEDGDSSLGREAIAPAVGVKMPTDLDLAVAVRKRREDDRAHRNAARAINDGAAAKPRVCSELGDVPLDAFDCRLPVEQRRGGEPAHDLGPSVQVEEAINLVQPPRADDETICSDHRRGMAAAREMAVFAAGRAVAADGCFFASAVRSGHVVS